MNIEELIREQRLLYPASHDQLFSQLTGHLPAFGPNTTMHCSNVSLQCFELVRCICSGHSPNVLEIGFNLGHSCTLFYKIVGARKVTSVDINGHADVIKAAGLVAERHPNFKLITGDSKSDQIRLSISSLHAEDPFDMVFVDGDHSVDGVIADVGFAMSLCPKPAWIFFDDLHPHWGPGTVPAIEKFRLKILAVQGNMCICAPSDGYIVMA